MAPRKTATKKKTTAKSATKTATKTSAKMATKTATKTKAAASRRPARPPDALALLIDDHRAVETLFATFEGLGKRAHRRREDVVRRMIEALAVHAAIEEQVFYPEVRQTVPTALDEVLESLEEHHVVKWTLSELEGMAPEDERFTPKVAVLMESVRHHVQEEEKEMFPQVRKTMPADQLQSLGDRLREAKETAPTRPHPRSPDTPPGNIVASALTAPLDVAANVAQAASDRVRDLVT